MKRTWCGHSAFRIQAGDAGIFIDPFPGDNPSRDGEWSGDCNKGKISTRGGDR